MDDVTLFDPIPMLPPYARQLAKRLQGQWGVDPEVDRQGTKVVFRFNISPTDIRNVRAWKARAKADRRATLVREIAERCDARSRGCRRLRFAYFETKVRVEETRGWLYERRPSSDASSASRPV